MPLEVVDNQVFVAVATDGNKSRVWGASLRFTLEATQKVVGEQFAEPGESHQQGWERAAAQGWVALEMIYRGLKQ